MDNRQLLEQMATHGNLSRGLADTLSELIGSHISQLALISALAIEDIKLEIDTDNVAHNARDYATHLLHEKRKEEEGEEL